MKISTKTKLLVLAGLSTLTVCAAAESPGPVTTDNAAPTGYASVQPIVAEHCVSCHRDGTGAPFALTDPRDVAKRAPQIVQVVTSGFMPPWKPDSHGELLDENRLSPDQIETIEHWADAGASEGGSADLKPVQPAGDLGKPDLVLAAAQPVDIPADSPGFYQCYILPTHFASVKYLSAIDFSTSTPDAADHVLEYMDDLHQVRAMNSVLPGDGFTVSRSTTGLRPSMVIGGWGICTPARRFPPGDGLALTPGADIILEVHYHGAGKPERDLPKVDLYFCHDAVNRQVRVAPVMANQFRLNTQHPMNDASAERPSVANISILGVLPYMRSHGHEIKLDLLLPDKSKTPLFSIPAWDFDWIGDYKFKDPVRMPSGSLLIMSAGFGGMQNATLGMNPYRKVTTWGDTLDDENAVAYIFYTTDDEDLQKRRAKQGIPELGGANDAAMTRIVMKMFDTNKNGRLDSDELRAMHSVFGRQLPHLSGMDLM